MRVARCSARHSARLLMDPFCLSVNRKEGNIKRVTKAHKPQETGLGAKSVAGIANSVRVGWERNENWGAGRWVWKPVRCGFVD